jgi:NADH-quinone oxidoreductase subunit L/NAD(P)H-quinone oxidoreductase subunit 5
LGISLPYYLLPLIAPLTLVVSTIVSFSSPGRRSRLALGLAEIAALLALASAFGSLGILILGGPSESPLIGMAGIGLSVRLDAVSASMLLLVAFVGWIVVRYARTYLDGEARASAFTGWLCATLAAVLLLVQAGNLAQLVSGWIATSLCLHRLLLFYPDRVGAPRARSSFLPG